MYLKERTTADTYDNWYARLDAVNATVILGLKSRKLVRVQRINREQNLGKATFTKCNFYIIQDFRYAEKLMTAPTT